ncbi:hypothetical protein WNY63_17740 [Pseudoalteromonas neustonica]|uniref:Uncharacterized protein n=1 Tax=Pseudoalteromonas neustonica TaxID=1840331 RepID=A0ABU9U6Y9_9GAMM
MFFNFKPEECCKLIFRYNPHRLLLSSLILSILFPFYVQADPQSKRISNYIHNIKMVEMAFSLVDGKCFSSMSLSNTKLNEIETITLTKTSLSYKEGSGQKEYISTGDYFLLLEKAGNAIEPLVANGCNKNQLNYFYTKALNNLKENLYLLKNEY